MDAKFTRGDKMRWLIQTKVWNLKKHVEALKKLRPEVNLFPITEVLDLISPNWEKVDSPKDILIREVIR
jgi:hypothetical protein